MDFVLLILGLILIIWCADILIDSSVKLAQIFKVSEFIIGLTIVAFGTSAPELAVGVISGVNKANALSLGNIIGSAIVNIAVVIGVCGLIKVIKIDKKLLKTELLWMIIAEVLLLLMFISDKTISRIEGLILFVGFILFLWFTLKKDNNESTAEPRLENELINSQNTSKKSVGILLLLTTISLAGLFVGGQLVVYSSEQISLSFGMSQTMIGICILSIATTLPELVASLTALKKNQTEIVLGNCIGSNLFNILLVLGSSSMINPIKVNSSLNVEFAVMIGVSLLLLIWGFAFKRIGKTFSVIIILSYVSFIIFQMTGI